MIAEDQKSNRILIVDDEPDVCEVLKKVLKKNGFTADSFSDPLLALENFRPRTYDLLLLDIKIQKWMASGCIKK